MVCLEEVRAFCRSPRIKTAEAAAGNKDEKAKKRKVRVKDQRCNYSIHFELGQFGHTHLYQMNGYECPRSSFFQNTVHWW